MGFRHIIFLVLVGLLTFTFTRCSTLRAVSPERDGKIIVVGDTVYGIFGMYPRAWEIDVKSGKIREMKVIEDD
jgi:hypothetical protein